MFSRILKWGNSLAVRIPKAFADEIKVAEGSSIHMAMNEGAIQITPVGETRWDLERLLSGITDENLHDEWETGRPEGSELW